MNERIEKLWTKVCQSEMPELDETCMTLQRRTKFAELIVKECTLIVSAIDRAQLRSGEYVDPAEMITKHFGVEE